MNNKWPHGGNVFQQTGTIFELKTAPPPGGHVFPPIMTIFELVRDNNKIDKTHILTKFYEDWTKNVTSKVFTCFHYIHIKKTAPPPGGDFHDDWAEFVTSRVLKMNNAPPPWRPYFIWTNFLTNFHEDRTINVAFRVFTNVDDGRTDRRRIKTGHKSSPEQSVVVAPIV
ncbi:hypothetical protein DPMN_113801 [Dreissena polymorpha]|uniref:Uncharacterized protein n=1 Tax=Dreissena polymorpha TaxID=45954 RepID=A0A9D4KIY2_DREPO|nr:hypothetical protein DPMN_113801 [Dreissena polymorpha]